jgi:WhiB family redox-sensing transcriptional regulator
MTTSVVLIRPASLAWEDDAACRGMDTEAFYTSGSGPVRTEARAVCARCPVTAECLDYVMSIEGYTLTRHQRHGVWAGTSEHDRVEIARRRRAGS